MTVRSPGLAVSPAQKAQRRRENIAAYLFMAPSLVFFLGFVIFPMGMCLVTSFFNYTMTDFSFIGFQNYAELFQDQIFVDKALINTLVIVIVSVPITCIFSLWVASLIYKMREWNTSFFRCVFYLPVVTGSVAVTVVWKWIFNNYYGILNYLMKNLGLITMNQNWLGSANTALGCIIMILLTTSVGQPIVLYVSALSNVDGPWWRRPPWTAPPTCRSSGRSSGPRSCPPPCTSWSSPPSTPSSASR